MATTVRHEEFGQDLGLIHEVVVTGRKVGADREFWAELAHDEGLFAHLVDVVKLEPTMAPPLRLVVDYSLSLKKMIEDGKYDWVNKDITQKNFPTKREGKVNITIELFFFDRYIDSQVAIKRIGQWGCRPARIEELCAIGAEYPDLQRQFSILALGTVRNLNGNLCVPVLDGIVDRTLNLERFDDSWHDDYRFAAVRQ